MIPPIYFNAIVFSSLLALLSTSLTLAYITTKLPNFTQGSLVTIGSYVALTTTELWKLNPYVAMVPGFFIGGITATLIYRLALRPQIKRHVPVTALMVTTLAVWIFFVGVINMYADYLQFSFFVPSRGFSLSNFDFQVAGEPGILPVAIALTIASIIGLFVLLTRSDFGIGLRAAAENPTLAEALGINIDRVNHLSWFLSGGLSGLAGALVPLWFFSSTNIGDNLLISMFAASTLGGLTSIFGTIVGAYIIGMSQILGTNYLADFVGSWIVQYQLAIPLAAMVVVLLIIPFGLGSLKWDDFLWRRKNKS